MIPYVFTVLLLCLSTLSGGEQTAYLQIKGMSGGSQDSNHQGWFEISSFEHTPYRWTVKGGSRIYLPKQSGDEFDGKLMLSRIAQPSAAALYEAVTKGTYFGNVEIDIPFQTGMGQKYIRWILSDVIVIGLSVEREFGKRGVPIERVTLNYQRAVWRMPNEYGSPPLAGVGHY